MKHIIRSRSVNSLAHILLITTLSTSSVYAEDRPLLELTDRLNISKGLRVADATQFDEARVSGKTVQLMYTVLDSNASDITDPERDLADTRTRQMLCENVRFQFVRMTGASLERHFLDTAGNPIHISRAEAKDCPPVLDSLRNRFQDLINGRFGSQGHN